MAEDEEKTEAPPRKEAPPVPPTPIIGNFRKHNNCLLVKHELGTIKQTTYNLPGPHHTYGKALYREDEGTGEMIMSWMEHVPNPHAKPGRDFKALNKGAVIAGAVTAKKQNDYRKTHDARLKIGTHEDRRFSLADDFVHGKSTRPSTPIKDLVSSAYRWSWVANHLEDDGYVSRGGIAAKARNTKPASTKASRGHALGALMKSQSLSAMAATEESNLPPPSQFTMKRFQKIPAKVTAYLPPNRTTMQSKAGETTMSAEKAMDATTSSVEAD
eukprot:CAMPEP_0206040344 /NCGR_PEP_ID=MMETSP1466-20131121/5317_1 /ASSEMBLY_ACC=CAM_ASM_001126 /TAXON_ID=44452 /ORGANISM="Pavlova gyrans, Strain CCMP608" /LENGTH=270 /DNA_ID=CAMNT_0053415017 /DNA_START=29 /DNA_END=841 /DNA_ORIENTATION=-